MDFSDALKAMKAGKRVRRDGWRETYLHSIVVYSNGVAYESDGDDLIAADWLIVEDQKPAEPKPINRTWPE